LKYKIIFLDGRITMAIEKIISEKGGVRTLIIMFDLRILTF